MSETNNYILKLEPEREAYDNFLFNSQYSAMTQASAWADVKQNWQSITLTIENAEQQGEIILTALLLIRRLPLGMSLMYLPFGPACDYNDQNLLCFFLKKIKELAKKEKCATIKIQMPLLKRRFALSDAAKDDFEPGPAFPQAEKITALLEKSGFKAKEFSPDLSSTLQPRYNAVIEKSAWPEVYRGKIKYNLKQCKKYGVEIVQGGEELLSDFCKCIESTEERRGISLRSEEYFRSILKAFASRAKITLAKINPADSLQMSKAELDGIKKEIEELPEDAPKKLRNLEERRSSLEKLYVFFKELKETYGNEDLPLAAAMYIDCGYLCEMPYAGSNVALLKIPAVWQVYCSSIEDAFSSDLCRHFSLGGVDGSFDDGLSRFKAHFSPFIHENCGEFNYTIAPFSEKLFNFLFALRGKLKSLARK